jgi:hypothetical protein
MNRLNPLVFPLPSGLRSTYSGIPGNNWLFDVSKLGLTGDHLVLWIPPDDYKADLPTVEVVSGYSSTFVNPDGDTYQIQATVREGKESAEQILKELIRRSYSGDTVTPITLYDYHRTTIGSQYTARQGVMWIEQPTGSFRSSNQNLSQGFNVVFKEV